MFTRQHYKQIANIIRNSFNQPPQTTEEQEIHAKIVRNLCMFFIDDNPRFDKQRFIEYINRKED